MKQNIWRRGFIGGIVAVLVVGGVAAYHFSKNEDDSVRTVARQASVPTTQKMRVNSEGLMAQQYFSKDRKLTRAEREKIAATVPMAIIGVTYGRCYDSDGDAIDSKYYPGTTTFTHEDGSVDRRADRCTDARTLTEFYCTRTLESDGAYVMDRWTYTCAKGCRDGACVF